MIKKLTLVLFLILNFTKANALDLQPSTEILSNIERPIIIGKTEVRFFGFKLYDITLFGEKEKFSYNQKLAIHIKYDKNFSKKELVETSIDEISRINNLDKNNLASYKDNLERIFVDIKKGDEKTAFYDPNSGLTLFYNHKISGKINDKVFAKRFMDIWLSENAMFKKDRNKLVNAE